ncbi:hypothetical protein O988_07192, partial [Pseudogymnoascus sp. VKM F-3808]
MSYSSGCENRLAVPIPFALLENIKIYFEESLPLDAVDLLKRLLVTGKTIVPPKDEKWHPNSAIPPPSYIDLASTFAIHPRHTTHSKSREDHRVAIEALDYLQHIPALLSIRDSGLSQTFRFEEARSAEGQRWERGTKRKARVALDQSEGDAGAFDDDLINHPIARDGIWAQATDFWHVVGWVMNCAARWRERWVYWQLWMEFVVAVLERDVRERISLRDSGEEGEAGKLEESMIGRFLLLNEPGEGRQVWKRAVLAIFADGSERAVSQFPPVWRDETKEPKEGDYKAPKTIADDDGSGDWLRHTGPEVRDLRIRLMALLLEVCNETQSTSSPTHDDLSDLLASHITHLPYPVYSHLLRPSPHDTLLPADLSNLTQIIISWLIDHAAPPNPDPDESPTQDTLATCFLPFAANTSALEDNVRLSWALEVLVRMYFDAERDARPASG